MTEGPEKKLPQETAEYYSWLLRIEWADFEKELMEIASNKSPSLILNETATWPHVYQMGAPIMRAIQHDWGHHRGCPYYLICIIYNQ